MKTRELTRMALLTAIALTIFMVEAQIPPIVPLPGVKLGLANTLTLLLVAKGDIKGAFAVNIARILLSGLLFASPSVLIYSLTAGLVSLTVMSLLSKLKQIGIIGFSVAGAVIHNITQLAVAFFMVGAGVLYYLPFLLISAVACGIVTAEVAKILLKNLKV